ncbi:MAG: hypothetical protein WC979_00495 [Candidatus Pacearchaeota archaeon]|jgi:hypothetical protein|nr:hypothetical protein [Clostridia bacterium]
MLNEKMFTNRILNLISRSKGNKQFLVDELSKLYVEMNPADIDNMTTAERHNFGSPLNKFADEANVRNISMVNIDLSLYSRNSRKLRIIEYKHGNEKISNGHKEQLEVYSELGALSNKFDVDVSIVYSDYPFSQGIIKFIEFDKVQNKCIEKHREFKSQGEMRMFLNLTDKRK